VKNHIKSHNSVSYIPLIIAGFCVCIFIMLNGCASSQGTAEVKDAESAFRVGLAAFKDENYFESKAF